jgi:hypothetical protein
MKTKDQSAQESDEKLLGDYFVKKFTPIAVVLIVAHMVLILVLDALDMNREISALLLIICGGLIGVLSRRYMKRKFMSIWTSQGGGTDQTPWAKEATSRR